MEVLLVVTAFVAWIVAMLCVWETEQRARDALVWGTPRPLREHLPRRLVLRRRW